MYCVSLLIHFMIPSFNFSYFLKATLSRRLNDTSKELDVVVHTLSTYPELNSSIKMEVGIEDCLHIEFEYNKSKYESQRAFIRLDVFLTEVRSQIRLCRPTPNPNIMNHKFSPVGFILLLTSNRKPLSDHPCLQIPRERCDRGKDFLPVGADQDPTHGDRHHPP